MGPRRRSFVVPPMYQHRSAGRHHRCPLYHYPRVDCLAVRGHCPAPPIAAPSGKPRSAFFGRHSKTKSMHSQTSCCPKLASRFRLDCGPATTSRRLCMIAPRASICVLLATSIVGLAGGALAAGKIRLAQNLNCDDLHDELQQCVCPLPIVMRQPQPIAPEFKSRHH
jgi:hypothetical protein